MTTDRGSSLAWLDERFDHLCDLDADDIDYDGQRVGAGSDTVQEALDELYERIPAPVTWPTVAADGISWRNDRPLSLNAFQRGLEVTFSEEMHAATATTSAFVVTLELPRDDDNPQLTVPTIVDGEVGALGRTWTFLPRGIDADQVKEWIGALGGRLRCRVRLLSDVIVDRDGTRPLDGNATAVVRQEGYDTFVDLQLPSGDGNAAGDFHSWFFLEGPAPLVRVERDRARCRRPAGDLNAPQVVMISFSGPVRFDTLSADTVQMIGRGAEPADRSGGRCPGRSSRTPSRWARDSCRGSPSGRTTTAFTGGGMPFRLDRIFTVVVGRGRPSWTAQGRPAGRRRDRSGLRLHVGVQSSDWTVRSPWTRSERSTRPVLEYARDGHRGGGSRGRGRPRRCLPLRLGSDRAVRPRPVPTST